MGLCTVDFGHLLLKILSLAFLHRGWLFTVFRSTFGLAFIVMQSDLLPLRCCRSVRSTKVRISGGTALLQDVTTLVCPFTFSHQQVTLLLLMRQKTHVLKLFLLSSERSSQMPGVDEP